MLSRITKKMLKISKKKDNTVIDEFKKMVFTSMVHLQINNAELSKLSGVTNSKISALKYGNSNTLINRGNERRIADKSYCSQCWR